MRVRSAMTAVVLASVAILTAAGTAAADSGDYIRITQVADSNVGPDPDVDWGRGKGDMTSNFGQ